MKPQIDITIQQNDEWGYEGELQVVSSLQIKSIDYPLYFGGFTKSECHENEIDFKEHTKKFIEARTAAAKELGLKLLIEDEAKHHIKAIEETGSFCEKEECEFCS